MKEKKFYLNIVLTVVVSYILIKFIDNYQYFFNVVNLLLSLLTPFVIAFILKTPATGFSHFWPFLIFRMQPE